MTQILSLFITEAGTQAGKVTEDNESHRTTLKSYTHRTTWRKPYASPQRKQICSNIACRKNVQAKEQTNKRACAISQWRDIFSLRIFITLSAMIVQKYFQCQQQIKYFCNISFKFNPHEKTRTVLQNTVYVRRLCVNLLKWEINVKLSAEICLLQTLSLGKNMLYISYKISRFRKVLLEILTDMESVWNTKDGNITCVLMGCA